MISRLFSFDWPSLRTGWRSWGIILVLGTAGSTMHQAAVEIVASTSYVLPGAPGRLTELGIPVPLSDGGTALVAQVTGESESKLCILRPSGITIVRPADLGLAAGGINPFIRVIGHGTEALFVAYNANGGSGIGIYRADPDGPVVLVDDPVAAAQQQRNSWMVGEWTARAGAFAMVSYYPMGRLGFAPMSIALSYYRSGRMQRIAAAQVGTPAFAGFSHLALDPSGEKVLFRGIFATSSTPGSLPTYESGIYAWENGALRTVLDPRSPFASAPISIASCAIGDDQAVAFFDSRRLALALFAEGRITELVNNGARTTDGMRIELDNIQSPPEVLRLDARHLYFIAPRRLMNPWGEEGVRSDVIVRVPRAGGPAEVFFHPARAFSDATRISITNLTLAEEDPVLTFRLRGNSGTQQAIYRATPPFSRIPFPAVPPGFPSVVLEANWPDFFFHRAGDRATVQAQVEGPGPFSYEWFLNGQPVSAATAPYVVVTNGNLTLFPFAQSYHSGDYTLAVTNAAGTSVVTAPVSIGGDAFHDGSSPPALVNYSVRGFSTTAEGVFTAGFSLLPPVEVTYTPYRVVTTLTGTVQQLLVRAVGPGLAPFTRADVVPAPATRLELFRGTQLIGRNDGAWSLDPTIAITAATVGAFPLVSGSRDSALVASLSPQSYTAQAAVPAGDGTVLMEFYVVAGRGNLRNLSARGLVADLEPRSLTLGFVISGSGARPVLLRAVGPSLQALGVSNAATQPRLELYDAENTLLARNQAHGTAPNSAEIRSAAAEFGAFPLLAVTSDAALLLHLPAGVYVARVAAAPGTPAGIALLEFYTNIGYETRN